MFLSSWKNQRKHTGDCSHIDSLRHGLLITQQCCSRDLLGPYQDIKVFKGYWLHDVHCAPSITLISAWALCEYLNVPVWVITWNSKLRFQEHWHWISGAITIPRLLWPPSRWGQTWESALGSHKSHPSRWQVPLPFSVRQHNKEHSNFFSWKR